MTFLELPCEGNYVSFIVMLVTVCTVVYDSVIVSIMIPFMAIFRGNLYDIRPNDPSDDYGGHY
jgi:hypothetical protein